MRYEAHCTQLFTFTQLKKINCVFKNNEVGILKFGFHIRDNEFQQT